MNGYAWATVNQELIHQWSRLPWWIRSSFINGHACRKDSEGLSLSNCAFWSWLHFLDFSNMLRPSPFLIIECVCLYWSSLTFFFVIDNWVCWSIFILTYILLCHWQLSVLIYICSHLHSFLSLTIECVRLYWSSLTFFFVIDNWVCWSILVSTYILLCRWQLSVLVYIHLNLHSSLSLTIECVNLYLFSLTFFFVIDNWVC